MDDDKGQQHEIAQHASVVPRELSVLLGFKPPTSRIRGLLESQSELLVVDRRKSHRGVAP